MALTLSRGLGLVAAALAAAAGAADAPAPAATPIPTRTLLQGVAHDALFAVAFDGANGIAGGAPGRVLRSADAGRTWQAETAFPSQLAVLGVALRDGRTLAVGQMGTIHRHEGQGAWAAADSGTKERLMSVSLNGAGLAIAVGAFGTLLKSTDAGRTWRTLALDWTPYLGEDQVAQGIQPHLFAVQVSEQGTIAIAGEYSLILRSSDGGATWTAVHRGGGDAAGIFALDLRADGIGYAVGQDGLVLRSSDGGLRWAPLATMTKANLLGVSSAGDRVVISAMHDMLASGDGGASWRRVQSPDVQSGWYSGIGVTGDAFVAVGHAGRVIKVNF